VDTTKLVVWFTGLPCSGKTTVADMVAKTLEESGLKAQRIDGDVVRETLCKDLGFSDKDRITNMERISFVARMLAKNGIITLCSFVSPTDECREVVKNEVEKDCTYMEVHVECPVGVCISRDVKGMYRKAMAGGIKGFTGVDSPYEKPQRSDIIIHTDIESKTESAEKVVSGIMKALGL